MLRSVFLKTLRDQRFGILGWGAGVGLLLVITAATWARVYPDASSRAALAAQVKSGLSMAEVLYGEPRNIDRLGGFLEWRVLGLAPVLFGIFLVLAATGVTRGAEEAGTIEAVMATPSTRLRVLLQQVGALLAAILLACAAAGLLLLAAVPVAGEGWLPPGRVAGSLLNVAVAASLFGALGLLAAQLTSSRRAAATLASIAMFACHIGNTLGLVVPVWERMRPLSPLYLYSRSSPLSNGHVDALALGALALLAGAIGGLAVWLSTRRDLFAPYRLPQLRRVGLDREGGNVTEPARPSPRAWLLKSGLGRGLRDAVGSTLAWGLGLAALAVVMTAMSPSVRHALAEQSQNPLYRRFERAGFTTEAGIVSLILFSFLPLLVTLHGVTLAASWAREETSQRLEMELACPPTRTRVFAGRLTAALLSAVLVVAMAGSALAVTARVAGIDLGVSAVLGAVGSLVPLAGAVLALGFAVSSWRPAMVAAAAGGFVAVQYFADLLVTLFQLPEPVRNVSVFHLYGQPLMDGVNYPGVAALAGAMAILACLGLRGFARKDIAK